MSEIRAEKLRPDVLITALASRLADLQGSRIDLDASLIVAPNTVPEAGRRALIAGYLFAALEQRVELGDTGFVPVEALHSELAEVVPGLESEEVRFVARFLDVDREIRYQELIDGQVDDYTTRGWSRLVQYQSKRDRLRLTDAGRLWLQIQHHRDNWLFQDKDIEKLVVAIKNGLFEQIPGVAAQAVSSLRWQNQHLTKIIESPSFHELVHQYRQRRDHISGMMKRCHVAAMQALELLGTDAIAAKHEVWASSVGEDRGLPLLYLREHTSRVHRATESLRRNWTRLLDIVQQNRRPMIGVQRFDLALDRYLAAPPEVQVDRIFLDGICGWGHPSPTFSVLDIVGSFPDGIEASLQDGLSFDCSETPSRRKMRTWLAAHREMLLARLANHHPHSLFDLVEAGDLPIPDIAAVSAVFGLYVITDPFGAQYRIWVEHSGGHVFRDTRDHRVTASDVTVRLVQEAP